MLSDLDTLFDANVSQAKSLAAIYQVLLGGVPNIAGFTALINANNASNFGAGPGQVFNDENIYINVVNSLVQGNSDAKAAFETLSLGSTLKNQVEAIYRALIPAPEQTTVGLDYVTRPDALAFYVQVAAERGIAEANGPARIALASILKVMVDNDIGIGDAVNDMIAAVKDGTAVLPDSGTIFTQIEIADGTKYDGDDKPTGFTSYLSIGLDEGGLFAGTNGADTFVANDIAGALTFTTADAINGSGGIDSLIINQAAAFNAVPLAATVTNVENVLILSGSTIAIDASTGFFGMTMLTTNSQGGATVAAAATSDIVANEGAQAATTLTLNGGRSITVNAIDLTTGITSIGTTTATKGSVAVNSSGNYTDGSNIALGAINVTGGANISVTQVSGITLTESVAAVTDASNFAVTFSDVNITGDAATTSVSVTGEEHRDVVAGAAGVTESVIITFSNLGGGQSFTFGGLTVTNPSFNAIGKNDVSKFFADVAEGGTGDTSSSQLISSGKLVGWSTSPLLIASSPPINTFSGNSTRVTSTTADTNVTDLAITGSGAGTTVLSHHIEGAAQVNGAVGVTSNTVIIDDKNFASVTDAGTVSTVTLNDVHAATIRSSALTTLNLSGPNQGFVSVSATSLTTPVRDTLNVNLNGFQSSVGLLITETSIKTLNVNSSGLASMLGGNGFTINTVTALNISGDARFDVGGAGGNSHNALTDINVTNSAGVSLANILNISTKFSGGDGSDAIAVVDGMTGVINMGKGNDTVSLTKPGQVWALGTGGSLNGGDGTDTIIVNTGASDFAAMAGFGGFEVLRIEGNGARDNHNASGFIALELGDTVGAASSFSNVASGVGLKVIGSPSGENTVGFADASGGSDVFALELNGSGLLNVVNGIVLHGMETINITNTDTDSTAHTNNLKLDSNTAISITVSGNAGLNLTNSTYAKVTSFDASGVTGVASDAVALGVTYVSGNTTPFELVSIKGGSGSDTLTGTVTATDIIIGGDGVDKITYQGGSDVFTGGIGRDHFVMAGTGTKTSFATITDISAGETIDLSALVSIKFGWQDASDLNGAEITGGISFNDFLDKAADHTGGISVGLTTTKFAWFKSGGDTYMVIDDTNGTNTFVSGADTVIKLTGGIDLSNSMITDASIFMFV